MMAKKELYTLWMLMKKININISFIYHSMPYG